MIDYIYIYVTEMEFTDRSVGRSVHQHTHAQTHALLA